MGLETRASEWMRVARDRETRQALWGAILVRVHYMQCRPGRASLAAIACEMAATWGCHGALGHGAELHLAAGQGAPVLYDGNCCYTLPQVPQTLFTSTTLRTGCPVRMNGLSTSLPALER